MALTVAAIQPEHADTDSEGALRRAEQLVDEAAGRGAGLILCPELVAAGNGVDLAMRARSEPFEGRTVAWLRSQAVRYCVTIGASFLEELEGDVTNTFVLVEADGTIAGTVRKYRPPTWERFFSKSVRGSHLIEARVGRVGVGICAESHGRRLDREWGAAPPTLILMPHAESTTSGRPVCAVTAQRYACRFGVPVVLANKAGSFRARLPLLPVGRIGLRFTGGSTVCNAGAAESVVLDANPGLAIMSVEVGGAARPRRDVSTEWRWLRSKAIRGLAAPLTGAVEVAGALSYRAGRRRRQTASP